MNISDLTVKDVVLALFVAAGTGKHVHVNRPSHGFVLSTVHSPMRYLFSDGTVLTVLDGDLYYLPQGSDYRVVLDSPACEEADMRGEVSRHGLGAEGDYAINFHVTENFTAPPFRIPTEGDGTLLAAFHRATDAWYQRSPQAKSLAMVALYEAFAFVTRRQEAPALPTYVNKIILPAVEEIRKRYTDPTLTVRSLASLCHVSEPYFRRLFVARFGKNPGEYISCLRIERAKELLDGGQFSVTETASLCGYTEACHFTREFHRRVGVSPGAFRKKEL